MSNTLSQYENKIMVCFSFVIVCTGDVVGDLFISVNQHGYYATDLSQLLVMIMSYYPNNYLLLISHYRTILIFR